MYILPIPYSSFISSNSFSLLPSKPQIFHGRDSELEDIRNLLTSQCARVAILGAGGMGKTSLARSALHHHDVASKYEQRFFVACDSATTSIQLAALIGSHLGLEPQKDHTYPICCSIFFEEVSLPINSGQSGHRMGTDTSSRCS